MSEWFQGKKTIITVLIVGLFNLTRLIFPHTPVLSDQDVALFVDSIGTILAIIFRLIAKPKGVPSGTP